LRICRAVGFFRRNYLPLALTKSLISESQRRKRLEEGRGGHSQARADVDPIIRVGPTSPTSSRSPRGLGPASRFWFTSPQNSIRVLIPLKNSHGTPPHLPNSPTLHDTRAIPCRSAVFFGGRYIPHPCKKDLEKFSSSSPPPTPSSAVCTTPPFQRAEAESWSTSPASSRRPRRFTRPPPPPPPLLLCRRRQPPSRRSRRSFR
jgi:hypothetical protein